LTDHGLDRMFWKGKGAFILGCTSPFKAIMIDRPGMENPEKTCRKSLTNLSQNVVLSAPRLREVRTHNVSGDRYWLHRYHTMTTTTTTPPIVRRPSKSNHSQHQSHRTGNTSGTWTAYPSAPPNCL
jgi:hypothetical protein